MSTGPQTDSEPSCRDKLLLSQAVYELGADDWPKVSGILVSHPYVDNHTAVSTPEVGATILPQLWALTQRV